MDLERQIKTTRSCTVNGDDPGVQSPDRRMTRPDFGTATRPARALAALLGSPRAARAQAEVERSGSRLPIASARRGHDCAQRGERFLLIASPPDSSSAARARAWCSRTPCSPDRPHGRLRRAVAAWLLALLALLAAAPASAQTPSLSSISFLNSPDSGDTYTRGEVIRISVYFDGDVELSNPHLLRLALTVGSVTEQVPHVVRSARELSFTYTVKQSDLDADGISVPANPLSLNGGAITVPGDPVTAVTLTHPGIADDATRKVNGSTVVAPTVQRIGSDRTPTVGDTFRRGEIIRVVVSFDKAVRVTGLPQLALTIGTSVRNANLASGHSTPSTAVRFNYTVAAEDVDADGISVAANALSLSGGAIQLADGTIAADITHAAVAADPALKVDGTLVLPPTVTRVYVGFQPDDGSAYQLGEEIRARAEFDRAIEVTGRPQLALTIGTIKRQATYSRIWGDRFMEFLYTVQASDTDADGISISADALTLNGGTIKGADRVHDAVLTHDVADDDPVHKVAGSTSSAPQVASVGFSFTPRSGETYTRGETITITVQFDRMAEVTGSPRVALTIGSNTRYATYHSVSTPRPFKLRFVYTVQASDVDLDGASMPPNAVELNGGAVTLPGVPTVAAVLTHSNVDNDPARKVDGSLAAAPTVDAVAFFGGSPLIGTTYTAGEVIGAYARFDREVDATGEPQLALAIGANTRQASFGGVWESNPRYVLFSYIVQTSDLDADGINVPADALSLNGGTITLRDDATTDAVLIHSATATDEARKVDGAKTSAPVVLGVRFSNAPSGGDTYALREEITADIQFTKALDVTGAPSLALTIGANTRQAEFQSILGSCRCTLKFSYRVQASDMDDDGIEIATDSLSLNGGTIKLADASSVDAVLSHSAVNADATRKVSAMPSPPRPGPGPPDPGPVRQTVPSAPRNLLAEGGDGQVKLTWEAPRDDGGSEIRDYEYRIDGKGRWISIGTTDTTHTVTGLTNGTTYTFEVRAVNRNGESRASNQAEAMLPAVLDFAHFANGNGIISDFVFVNVSPHPIRPAIYFYDRGGRVIDPASVVDVTVDLEVTEDGGLTVRTEMEPLGELTISTHGQGELVSGSVKVVSDSPIGGGVRYSVPDIGVAGVGASPPVRDVLFPARRQAGGIRTATALHNLGEEAVGVRCRLMSGGVSLEEVEIPLEANGQTSWFIEDTFTTTDTSDFLGSVRCTVFGSRRFTAIAVEMDAAQRIFNTLSVVPVDRTGGGGGETVLDFAHFVNGTWITDLVLVNLSTEASRPALTPVHTDILPSRPAIYFYDTEGNQIAAASVVDITGDLEISEDGALTVRTEMEPLGVLTISTHGRGELVSGSVRVVSEGPIGGMLRFEHPDLGVAGVGAGPPVSDVLFPVRRQEGGITTGVALHNLESSAGLVHCDLMREGVLLDGASIPLEANGQTSWLIDQAFPDTDTSDFAGSVRCSAPGGDLFTAVALEMDHGTRIFTTLPVVPVPERTDRE